jgi:serine/threonine-protein kinase
MAQPPPPRDDDTRVIQAEDTAEFRAPETPPPAAPPPPAPPPARFVENPWPWLLLVGLVAAGIVVWLFLFRGNDKATVPRVVGLPERAAIERLNDKGFDNTFVVRTPSKTPRGQVFAQKPGAGTQLDKDQTVTIRVSSGAPVASGGAKPKPKPKPAKPAATEVVMPDVVGRPLPDAGGELEAAGLVPDSEPVASEEPPGTAVAQEPGAGTKVPAGEIVHLQVARGGGTVSIPDVVGQTAAEARAKLWAARLTVRTVYRSGRPGVVLAQQPTGTAPAYSQVALTVGR